jgi:hypothetical protein
LSICELCVPCLFWFTVYCRDLSSATSAHQMRPSINLGYGVANVQPLVQNKFKRGLNSISRQSFIFYYLTTVKAAVTL